MFFLPLRQAGSFLLAMSLLLGLVYPALVTLAAQALFPHQANGSLVVVDGRVIGSERIGQGFASARAFQPRPSAAGSAGYDAGASGGTNLGVSARVLQQAIAARVAALRQHDPDGRAIPADLVMASASGLDPDLSPAAAAYQVPRVAAARGLPEARVQALVDACTQGRQLGFLGEPRVNVLALNRALGP